jgi:hypothetical protein
MTTTFAQAGGFDPESSFYRSVPVILHPRNPA